MPAPQPGIAEVLQTSFAFHLEQAEAFEAQAAHFARWGYPVLAEEYNGYAKEERQHAGLVADRLEFFDVQPDPTHSTMPWPRDDFEGILDSNYDGVLAAARIERDGYAKSVAAADATSAAIFAELLKGSEDGMNTVEATRAVIGTIGLDNFLANKTVMSPPAGGNENG
jgi:bacterioferritin (cytochrome b1)